MNVQKIFEALHADTEKSAMGIICRELENQSYSVVVDDVPVTADEFFEGRHKDIETKKGPFDIALMNTSLTRKVKIEQEFCIEFTDHREFIIKQKKQGSF
ncbi:MAG TPA: hypothetical protein PLV50_13175 [Smithella sp.]|nr:hypothetical protein [Smithella sp.]MDM7987244.1 hypothetical protein [Smithella sp.]HNY51445.1 hypothetical protein [Smithella sp.]HOG91488.1 hypothetical protein [Smithella sp.]HOU52122.1 hypothetical protein [Smithella sp.]